MQTIASSHALHWEMYGPGTALAFCADADTHGYRVVLERDRSPVLTVRVADAPALFRVSAGLRAQLEHLGYGVKPRPGRASDLDGGPCWGPAAPLHSSLIESLQ
jgi:hypothetical protein